VNFADPKGGIAEVRARLASSLPSGFRGEWWLPDSTDPEFGSATRYFPVKQEDVLAFRLLQQTDDGEAALPWITFIFREATGPPQVAPKVQFRHKSGTIFKNVVNVSGTTADLEGGAFLATPPAGVTLTWRLGERGAPEGTTGNFINLPTLSEAGTQTLVLKDSNGHQRRVRIEIRNQGPLLIGNENGPAFLGGPAVPGELTGNFDLMKFHQGDGLARPAGSRGPLDRAAQIAVATAVRHGWCSQGLPCPFRAGATSRSGVCPNQGPKAAVGVSVVRSQARSSAPAERRDRRRMHQCLYSASRSTRDCRMHQCLYSASRSTRDCVIGGAGEYF
jgi:hypothetical protein